MLTFSTESFHPEIFHQRALSSPLKKDVVESKSIQTLLNPRIRSVICVEVTNLKSMPGSNRNNQNKSAKHVLLGPWQTVLCCNAWREVD